MELNTLVYAGIAVIVAVVVAAAIIWQRFKNFLVEELEAKLVTPIQQRLIVLEDTVDKLEKRVIDVEDRHLESQTGIQQKFETIIRDVADLKGRLEGMLGKFDLYLKIGDKYGKQ